jgi:hypothetical protein
MRSMDSGFAVRPNLSFVGAKLHGEKHRNSVELTGEK